jgi:SAM-dependent methyltransferase
MNYHRNTVCRACFSPIEEVFSFGEMPLANALVDSPKSKDAVYPLSLWFCSQCTLVQVPDVVRPSILFRNYYYITSTSPQLVDHFKQYSAVLQKRIETTNDLIVDIGGNDGTLLNELKDDCRVLNVDPAENIAIIARKKGVETLCEFFSEETAEKIIDTHGYAKVITASNVIAHTDSVRSLFEGVKKLLRDDGVFIFETHWVGNLIGEGGFDQIYHEHLCYYSLRSLIQLTEAVGLTVVRVERIPLNGESLRVWVTKGGTVDASVGELLEDERGLYSKETYWIFGKKIQQNKEEMTNLLTSLKEDGKKIVGYGAAAKGSTLLNYYGIGTDIVDYITDTSTLKQGKYMSGVHIPIVSPSALLQERPDFILLLAWNYARSILRREQDLRDTGVKFIIPVPKVQIV